MNFLRWSFPLVVIILISRFHWTFVDPPPLTLFHIGRNEVNYLLDLMEPEFSQPMSFVRGDGTVDDQTFDPAQVWGVQSTVPRVSIPSSLKEVRSPESSSLGLANMYEYKRLVAYLKANSWDKDRPLMPFGVSGHLRWSFLIQVVVCTVFELVESNASIRLPSVVDICNAFDVRTGRK